MNRPQPEASLTLANELLQHVRSGDRVLLTGPVDPDGDSIGACLALQIGLEHMTGASVFVAGSPGRRYSWLPRAAQMVSNESLQGNWRLVVVLDGDRWRLAPQVDDAFKSAKLRGIVDHHRSTTPEGYDLSLIDPTAASTCELIYSILQSWQVLMGSDLAKLLYTGLIFDTGGFRHSNTTPATHQLAAELLQHNIDHSDIALRVLAEREPEGLQLLGDVIQRAQFFGEGRVSISSVPQETLRSLNASPEDIEGIVDTLLHTRGVEVSCLLIEKPDGRVKLSLRSRSWVDVCALASSLDPSGGGHIRAAGVVLADSLSTLWESLPPRRAAAATPADA